MRLRLFGLEATVTKAAAPPVLASVTENRGGMGGWWPWIREPYAGAWQRNVTWTTDSVLSHHAVFACITLIASDIGKLRPKLMLEDANGIWEETESSAFSPVLRKPNRYQNYIQFKECWTNSKLTRGNTYALQERDGRGVVRAQYILDPSRVSVLVAPDGSIYYKLGQDNLTGVDETSVVVPASEILHDRINCLYHPLVGISPLFACGLAAHMGIKIQENGAAFFENGNNPGGILLVPTPIPQPEADRLKAKWDSQYGGENSGKVAVLTDGLKFQPLRMSSVDAQVIEHLKWTAETVCSAFHVPPFKVGVGPMPTYQNIETLNQIYYSDCLQAHIESYELVQDEGLGLTEKKDQGTLGVELDLTGLLRMDGQTLIKTLGEGVQRAIYSPNEARREVNLKPMPGGESPYLQQQNYSLAALDRRDKAAPAPSDNAPTPATPALPAPAADEPEDEERSAEVMSLEDQAAEWALRAKSFQVEPPAQREAA